MGTKLKIVLAFVAGAATGALATYYLTRESFRRQADEEIESVRNIYMRREADEISEMRKKEGIVEATEEELKDYHIACLRDLGVEIMTDEEYESCEDVNPVDDYEEEEEDGPTEYSELPEEIDESEFYNGWNDYESVTLSLYSKDGVIIDEVEDIVDDTRSYIGDFNVKDAIVGNNLYFVNHAMMLKIELEVLNQSYKRDVLGEDDEVEWGDKKPE